MNLQESSVYNDRPRLLLGHNFCCACLCFDRRTSRSVQVPPNILNEIAKRATLSSVRSGAQLHESLAVRALHQLRESQLPMCFVMPVFVVYCVKWCYETGSRSVFPEGPVPNLSRGWYVQISPQTCIFGGWGRDLSAGARPVTGLLNVCGSTDPGV